MRTCVSQHEQNFTIGQTLIMMVLVFLTECQRLYWYHLSLGVVRSVVSQVDMVLHLPIPYLCSTAICFGVVNYILNPFDQRIAFCCTGRTVGTGG